GLDQPRFSATESDWGAIHRYIEASLSQHFRFRYAQTEHCLAERFNLNPREIDVVEQIVQGKANADISEILEISLATVKVHVGSILRKMGVDSRLAIACVVNHIQKP
ncbi:MAG: LuxR family transcriptional regulator, partial [Novosphingobium sp.]